MSTAPGAEGPAEASLDEVGSTTDDERRFLASSAVMAAGTVVSRMSGFVRTALLAAALGNGLHADLFTIANTVPNMLYILLAGGIFNAVLVPQLVRSMKEDDDRGEAYTQRVITLAALFLAVVTVLLVLAAPVVMDLLLGSAYGGADLAAQRSSAIGFARYCLPQVFFYGMFVLVGQILNARGRFGPMMWAPIANNVIAVATLAVYLVAYGPASPAEQTGAFTGSQELVLGVGSSLGIVAQLVILLPYLRAAGFTFRARFDFRGTGLGHTLRLGIWTVLFVVVNQIAYTVVVRLASGGTAASASGTGITVYSSAFLIMMVPHAVVTVSLATAALPRLSAHAADGDLAALGARLTSTLRSALVVIVPFAALLPVLAPDLANVVWGHGSTAQTYVRYVPTLSLFGGGLVFFTVHYLMLRGFYAVEQTRTVFLIQCAVAATNVVAALALVGASDAAGTSPALVGAYTAAYAVGSVLSFVVLRRVVGGLPAAQLLRFAARLAVVVLAATGVALLVAVGLHHLVRGPTWPLSALFLLIIGAVAALVLSAAARVLGVAELEVVSSMVTSRLPGAASRARSR